MRSVCGKSARTSRPATESYWATASRSASSRTCRVVMSRAGGVERGADLRTPRSRSSRSPRPRARRPATSRAATSSRRSRARPAATSASSARSGTRGRRGARRRALRRRRQSRIEGHRPDLRPARPDSCRTPGRPRGQILTPAGQAAAERVDVARAEREQHVALAQRGAQVGLGLVEAGQPGDRAPAGGVGGRGGDEPAGDAGEVLLRARARGRSRAPPRRRRARARRRSRAPCARVREYRCGWKAATIRRAPSVRAASIVACTSVG